jgi:hypothetical protein
LRACEQVIVVIFLLIITGARYIVGTWMEDKYCRDGDQDDDDDDDDVLARCLPSCGLGLLPTSAIFLVDEC